MKSTDKCRCGHHFRDHFNPEAFYNRKECTRCDCRGFHTTRYKTCIRQLRRAATELRGKPLQTRLFSEDTAQSPEKAGTLRSPSPPRT